MQFRHSLSGLIPRLPLPRLLANAWHQGDIKSGHYEGVKLKHIKSNTFCQLFPLEDVGVLKRTELFLNDGDVFSWGLEQSWSSPSEVVMVFWFC